MESELDNIGCIGVTNKEADPSSEEERKGYHLNVRYLSEEVLGYLSNVIRPKEKGKGYVAWRLLKSKFAGNTTHAKGVAFGNLNKLRFSNTTQFVNDARAAISRLRAKGLSVDSECLSLTILQKLPRPYESLVRIISQMEPIPCEEDVLKRIEKDQIQFNTREKSAEALFTKKPFKKNYNKFDKAKRVKCFKCNKLGHIAKNCWSDGSGSQNTDRFSYKNKKKAFVARNNNDNDDYEEVTSLMADKANINDHMTWTPAMKLM
ncbi:hypothetical protein MJO28_007882 [Puccinia striiformis f. sp. tritici]|uniref:Uncharacterized protein n=1 Tax=Puccinia striiformis f. sp. tritici TaxID=168172 RepID=A0ACC0EAK8_9BASI|nr:hypothetical protein MJO28_007882 [Puccinia striiformis f. sp. tritici]